MLYVDKSPLTDLSYNYTDKDFDGYTDLEPGTVCSGDFLPQRYKNTPGFGVHEGSFGSGYTINAVTVGAKHACVHTSDRNIRCWGNNTFYQLGSYTEEKDVPKGVEVNFSGKQITAGGNHTCGLNTADELFCWGANNKGQLGIGQTSEKQLVPVKIFDKVKQLSVGPEHSCASIKADGYYELWCWGSNEYGQLGDGTTTDRPSPTLITRGAAVISGIFAGPFNTCYVSWTFLNFELTSSLNCISKENLLPVEVFRPGVNQSIGAVALGREHTCFVVEGALYCYGNDSRGQLGNGGDLNDPSVETPQLIISEGVTDVAAGEYNTCAVVNGSLQCFGNNVYGRLGVEGSYHLFEPTEVISSGVTAVDAEENTYCAIVNNQIQCFGNNVVDWVANPLGIEKTPIKVLDTGVSQVSASFSNTCIIVQQALWCVGADMGRAAGLENRNTFDWVRVIASGVTQVAVSLEHACAVVNQGLYCFGKNDYGRMGIQEEGSYAPAEVFPPGSGVKGVATGQYHTCAFLADGSAYCFGRNKNGELGTGDYLDSSTPRKIFNAGVTAVAIGSNHTCVIYNNELWCSGSTREGAISNGYPGFMSPNVLTPTRVLGAPVTAVTAWDGHTCAVVSGALKCFGRNTTMQLGTPDLEGGYSFRPVQPFNSGVEMASGGLQHWCAIKEGALYCFGNPSLGRTGREVVTSQNPVKVINSAVTFVSAGYYHTCAVVRGGLECFGSRSYGKLGLGSLGKRPFVVFNRKIGDINSDGLVDNADLELLKKHIDYEGFIKLFNRAAADLNSDDRITDVDYFLLMQKVAVPNP